MKRTRDRLSDNFQLIVFTITYVLSCLFLYGIFIYFASELHLLIQVFFSLGFLVSSIILWAYLFVLFNIPQKLAGAFDYIKNQVSTGEISSSSSFAAKLSAFLIKFFNYSFFDIHYAAVKILGDNIVFSSEEMKEVLNWQEIGEISEKSPELTKNGKIKINKEVFHSYTIPIFFNNTFLGFFTVFSKQRLGRLSTIFLTDLEENFIDDQLIRLIPRDK